MEDFLTQVLYGAKLDTKAPAKEGIDVVAELFQNATPVKQHIESDTTVSKTAEEWGSPIGEDAPLKKNCPQQERRTLACGARNIGARVERTGGWVKEFDASGSLLCGYLEE